MNNKLQANKVSDTLLKKMQENGRVFLPGEWYLLKYDKSFEVIQIIKIYTDTDKWGDRVKYRVSEDWDCTKFKDKEGSLNDILYDYYREYIPLQDGLESFKAYKEEAAKYISGEISLESYKAAEVGEINAERALVAKGSKQMLQALEQDLTRRQQHAEMIKTFVAMEMHKRYEALAKLKDQLGLVLAEFKEKIEAIQKIIVSIELYLGINEELHILKEGEPASQNEPICFRQMLLYMDEEMGVWQGGGLDFTDVTFFDEWVVKNDRYKVLLPESKGVIVFRPRRKGKYYSEDSWQNAIRNQPNLTKNYILIRNGEQVSRIFTEHISGMPRLFPKKAELQKMFDEMNKEDWESSKKKKGKEIQDILYFYKKAAILLQGLIDRTEVFHPVKPGLSIFKLTDEQKDIQFIYDDEATLPSGRLPFSEWHTLINSKIQEGSRVLNTGVYDTSRAWVNKKDFSGRFINRGEHNIPDLPKEGVYLVEEFSSSSERWKREKAYQELVENHPDGVIPATSYGETTRQWKLVKTKKDHFRWGTDTGHEDFGPRTGYLIRYTEEPVLTIKYHPGGKAKRGWSWIDEVDRVNKVRFIISPEDDFILNYDQISLDDVEFYLTSRVDRPNYLEMMPVLEKIKKELLKEVEKEQHFIRFVVDRNYTAMAPLTRNDIEGRVIESVAWWKFKNKWKRYIDKDDAKALRMIEKRILSPNYDKFEKYE